MWFFFYLGLYISKLISEVRVSVTLDYSDCSTLLELTSEYASMEVRTKNSVGTLVLESYDVKLV